MLQKVIVVLVGLIMSVVGALTPEGLFATPADDALGALGGGRVTEQTLATVRAADGLAFAKISVLWIEVDGKRVTEDAWGTGEVKELRFKVGVKGVEDARLAVGSKVVTLHPTDVLTIRTFRGDFAYRGLGTATATLQLQGTVQTTTLQEGPATGKVLTESPAVAPGGPAQADRIAYVVLDTGKRLDTVSREAGSARFFTEETRGASQAGNVLAKWVKIDGKLVREYTWGDGPVGRIEFEPALQQGGGVVSFEGAPQDVAPGTHVVVRDFVGEYLVYQVQGGFVRLKLDGYAEDFAAGTAGGVALPSGPGAPLAAFDIAPDSPRTTDLVTFRDRTTDNGVVVFWRWDFGDGVASALQDPTHRFTKPGAYNVTLNVTDDDLQTTQVSRVLIVRNADPAPDFEWLPRIVTTDSLVAFSDLSLDPDGTVVNWTWDFGDGKRSHVRSPTHQFTKSGTLTVTLTVVDDLGGRASVTKNVVVRNHPPVAAFEWAPLNPHARVAVTFTSLSVDRDGRILDWQWDFDGRPGADATGPVVAHTFTAPGTHVVSLTVTDDGGATDTATANVIVVNTAPTALFDWAAEPVPTVKAPVRFFNRATDSDGYVVLSEWAWGDGSTTRLVTSDPQRDVREAQRNAQYDVSIPPPPPDAEHQYARPGAYLVELCVTDNLGATDCRNRTVNIERSAPIADLYANPAGPHYRNQLITFTSAASRDPDGDPIVYRLLEFGDGTWTNNMTQSHTYAALGTYPVRLTVRDSTGLESTATMNVHVVNRPPSARISVSDPTPAARQPLTFTAVDVEDIDGPISAINYTWTFQPMGHVRYGQSVEYAFPSAQSVQVLLVLRDADGGESNQIARSFDVALAPPDASWTMSDETPSVGQSITFTDTSTSLNGPIRERQWTIGGEPVSTEAVWTYTFSQRGPVDVVLTVRDDTLQPGQASRTVTVNAPPVAVASVTPDGPYRPEQPLVFHDHSRDDDGVATITTRSWDFGDGTTLPNTPQTDVVHTYAAAGTYTVTLTVSDGQDASTTTLTVQVRGREPIAKWHIQETAPYLRGQALTFVSDSYDPDGSAIQSHSWSWGDGTFANGLASTSTTKTFANSGLYRVGLSVSDGQSTSLVTGESLKYVRIGADHPLTVDVSALLPHGGLADLTAAHVELTVQHASQGASFRIYPKSALVGGPDHLFLVLPTGSWSQGDTLEFRLRDARFMPNASLHQVQLRDEDGVGGNLPVQFRLALPLAPTVQALAETSRPLVTNAGVTVYDLDEPFHGAGRVTYIDGVAGAGAEVVVQLRYMPLVPVRDALGDTSAANSNALLGWCTVDETVAAADGTFTWTVEKDGCALDEGTGRPAGKWQVRAIARKMDATSGVSAPAAFYVDPTGLLGAGFLP